MIIPRFHRRKSRSAIIDISSLARYMSVMPMVPCYSSTKFFNYTLSQGYAQEDKTGKIDYLCLMPGYVTSKMTLERKDNDTISPKECAEECLKDLGQMTETFGHIKHVNGGWVAKNFGWIISAGFAKFTKNEK